MLTLLLFYSHWSINNCQYFLLWNKFFTSSYFQGIKRKRRKNWEEKISVGGIKYRSRQLWPSEDDMEVNHFFFSFNILFFAFRLTLFSYSSSLNYLSSGNVTLSELVLIYKRIPVHCITVSVVLLCMYHHSPWFSYISNFLW